MMPLRRQAGDLVELLGHGDAFDDVAELHDAGDLGEDRHREGIPLREELALSSTLSPSLEVQLGAVGQSVPLALATRLVLHRRSRRDGS